MTFRWQDYVASLQEGDKVTRKEMAEEFGVGRRTAAYHLDRAVESGELNRQYGWLGRQSGWLYALPSTMPRLEGL